MRRGLTLRTRPTLSGWALLPTGFLTTLPAWVIMEIVENRGQDIAEWLERLTASAEVATVWGFDPSIPRLSEI